MPALPPYIIEPVWEQFEALLPEHERSTIHSVGTDGVSRTRWSLRSWSRS